MKKLALKKKMTIFSLILQRYLPVRNWQAPERAWPEKGGEDRRQRTHCRPREEGEELG